MFCLQYYACPILDYMQKKLKISHSVNYKKGHFCESRTKAYFMKTVPLLIRNNPASVCPSHNSIIAPDKQYLPATVWMVVFLCKCTSAFTTHYLGKVPSSMTKICGWGAWRVLSWYKTGQHCRGDFRYMCSLLCLLHLWAIIGFMFSLSPSGKTPWVP